MLVREKIQQAVGVLRQLDIPCWLTFVRESALNGDPVLPFLASGPVTWHSAFIVTSAGEARAIVGRYDRQAVVDTGAYAVVEGYVQGIREPLLRHLRELSPERIAVNYSRDSEVCDGLTHGMYLTLVDMLADLGLDNALVSAEPIVSALRQRKTAAELENIRAAIATTEGIFAEVQRFLAPGRTEHDIAALVHGEVREAGVDYAWDRATCPSVFTGPDTAEAHYGPTARPVEPGHIVNMDFGVKQHGYCADLQRTYYIAQERETVAPADVQHGFDTIVRAIEAARSTLTPGAIGLDVDRAAREEIIMAGFDEFPHALGHQVGRSAHDGTALLGPAWEKYGSKPSVPIEQGMVFTLEPRLTVPGRGTVTIEEMVVVTANGAEYLSSPERELPVIRTGSERQR